MSDFVLSKKAIGHGAFWSILNQATGQVLGLLVFLITARYVPKEAFGTMGLCLLVTELFRNIWSDSIGISIEARANPSEREYNAAFVLIVIGGFVCAGLVALLADPIARLMGHREIAYALHWFALLPLVAGLSRTHETWLYKHLDFKSLALRSLCSFCVGGAVGIVMAVNGFGLLSLIAQQLVIACTSLAFLWVATEWRPSLDVHWTDIRSILRYSRHLSATAVSSMANNQSDVFFSSYYLGPAATGVYLAAKRILIAIIIMFSSSLGNVALPAMSAVVNDPERSASGFLKAVSMTSILSAAVFAGLAAMAPDFVQIIMGGKWADVAPIIAILAVNGYLSSISQYDFTVMMVKNKPHWITVLITVNALINVVMFMIVGPYGLIALATAYVIKNLAVFPVELGITLRLLKLKPWPYIAGLLPSIFCALAMAAVVTLAREHLVFLPCFVRIALLVPGGAVIYFALMAIFCRKAFQETASILLHMIKKDAVDNPVLQEEPSPP
jgi:O-antigen/teichoic acid export membrane protein